MSFSLSTMYTNEEVQIHNEIPQNLIPRDFEILNNETEGKIVVESPEIATELAVSYARWLLEHKYGPDSESPKTFHDVGHTEMIATLSSLVAISLIENDLGYILINMPKSKYVELEPTQKSMINSGRQIRTALAYQTLLTWMHDVRQDGEIRTVDIHGVPISQLFRNRGVLTTQNEGGSGSDLADLLEKFVYPDGRQVFEGYTRRRCVSDVNATYVNYEKVEGYDVSMLNQPCFDTASIFGQILALTDLAGNLCVGLEDTHGFRDIVGTGNREFAELFPDLLSMLVDEKATAIERFVAVQKAYAWVNPMQVGFVESQVWLKDLHIKLLERIYNSQELVSVLQKLFGGSDEIVTKVTERATNLSNMRLDEEDTVLGAWVSALALYLGQPDGRIKPNQIPLLQKAAKILASELEF